MAMGAAPEPPPLSASVASAWRLPPGVPVIAVETDEDLDECSALLDAAVCCGIDAEWPPVETAAEARGGGPPHATLVQLALWLPAGAAAPHGRQTEQLGSGSACVLLLDMMALPAAAAKHALQRLFRNKQCLKLGFGLVHDLRAIAAALGGEGGSCIAVVAPAADLGSIHRFLRHRRLLGVHRAVDPGLSGLVEAQLGLPLDKALQCSAWGERPLSEGQQQYAAADAACLLGLLGSLIAAVGQPEEWPMAEPAAAAEEAAEEAAAPGAEDCVAAAEAAAEEAEAEEAGTPAAGPSGSGSQGRGGGPAAPPAAAVPPQEPGADALLGGCSVQQLQAAAEAWGVRLEISGARAVRRGGRRGQRQRLKKRQGQGLREPDTTGALPLHIPWLDAQRQLVGEPRFLCDVMAEGLARQLRLCGFDTESLQATMEKAPRHAIYRTMVERAEAEARLVLTRDRTFVAANYSDQAFLVQSDTKQQQLEEVLAAFGLAVEEGNLLTRCGRCNGEFIPEPLPAAALPAGHGVPPGILERHAEFWVCARCSAVFWQGGQFSRARRQGEALVAKMAAMRLAPA